MYVPPPYLETRRSVLLAAIEARSFGTLITALDGEIMISHLPFAVAGEAGAETLIAHLARSNPQWRAIAAGATALASFLLDDAYISPGWYPSKAETGRVVPTWNYVAVEARGPMALVETGPELLALVDKLTGRHESGREHPWSTSDAPAEFTAALLNGIVGVRMTIEALTGAWKLGQKKRPEDRDGAARGLSAEGASLASLMRAGRAPVGDEAAA
ncbi:MAG: hypothetical protein A4S16_06135 [Proteobacteria bacterium SG_bin6]|nr:MAG: hypothetical protein A4S16_06135 [Proteobacteria bacterium SG_bin6]